MSEFINRKLFIAATQSLHCEPCNHRIDCLICNVGRMIRKIKNFPSADVAPVVHGHWSKEMRFTEDFMGNRTYGYKCSVCGKLANRLQFCGNCGAKMDEREDSDNE